MANLPSHQKASIRFLKERDSASSCVFFMKPEAAEPLRGGTEHAAVIVPNDWTPGEFEQQVRRDYILNVIHDGQVRLLSVSDKSFNTIRLEIETQRKIRDDVMRRRAKRHRNRLRRGRSYKGKR